jgi:hypothetical protein
MKKDVFDNEGKCPSKLHEKCTDECGLYGACIGTWRKVYGS